MLSTWRRSTGRFRSWRCWTTPTSSSSTRWVTVPRYMKQVVCIFFYLSLIQMSIWVVISQDAVLCDDKWFHLVFLHLHFLVSGLTSCVNQEIFRRIISVFVLWPYSFFDPITPPGSLSVYCSGVWGMTASIPSYFISLKLSKNWARVKTDVIVPHLLLVRFTRQCQLPQLVSQKHLYRV